MILDVNYRYSVSARLGRKRLSESAFYVGRHPVEVREATDAEAPVALRFDGPYAEGVAEMRWFDGCLYEPYDVDDGDSHVVAPDASFLARQAADPQSAFFHRRHLYATLRGAIGDDAELRHADDGDRREVVAELDAKASTLLCVDGTTWRRAVEPVLRLTQGRGRDGVEYASVDVDVDPEGRGSRACFRIDHGHRIASLARLGAKALELPFVEVLVPQAVLRRVDERNLTDVCGNLVGGMSEALKDASRRYFDAYATLRDAHAAAVAGLGDPDDDAPFHALARAAVDAEAIHLARRGDDVAARFREDVRQSDVERAVERWESGLDQEAGMVLAI